jgi:hypothetical protein
MYLYQNIRKLPMAGVAETLAALSGALILYATSLGKQQAGEAGENQATSSEAKGGSDAAANQQQDEANLMVNFATCVDVHLSPPSRFATQQDRDEVLRGLLALLRENQVRAVGCSLRASSTVLTQLVLVLPQSALAPVAWDVFPVVLSYVSPDNNAGFSSTVAEESARAVLRLCAEVGNPRELHVVCQERLVVAIREERSCEAVECLRCLTIGSYPLFQQCFSMS